jgi:DNA-binding NarL/FixJ family response regulator
LVEDQVMFLELLTGLLVARPGLQVVAQAQTVQTAVEACHRWKPDLLLLDLALPDGDGLAVAREFLSVRPDGKVILLSGQAANFVCPIWLNDHVQAVISKNAAFDVLRIELDKLLGEIPPSPASPALPEKQPAPLLSDREAAVYMLIGDGLSSAEIATRLGVSSHTVHTHRKRLASKLGTKGDELMRRAMAHRLSLSPPVE